MDIPEEKMSEVPVKKKKPAKEKPAQKYSVLRRHRINEGDVRRVLSHLKANGTITADDHITRPRAAKAKQSPNELVPWAVPSANLAGSWQHDLKSGPNNQHLLYAQEHGVYKRVVPLNQIDTYLRHSLLDPDSTMPMGRDSAYHHVQKSTIGISRRALYKFLEKQAPLQVSKNIPNERRKGGMKLQERGYCEMDLIEGKGRDLNKIGKTGPRGDWYWLAIVDNLTGYGLVHMIRRKSAKVVAPALKTLLDEMRVAMHKKVHTIAADHGREFYADVKTLLKRRGIKLKQVSRGSRVEKFNQDFQRNFYRILRLQRGSFASLQTQAVKITNNTRNKNTGKTPQEALDTDDKVLRARYNKTREEQKPYKGAVPEIGDKCRHLIKLRKNIRPMMTLGKHWRRLYKSYHGEHFSRQVYKITAKTRTAVPKYYVNGRWRELDELLLVSGTDAETDRQIAARAGV